MSLSDKPRRFWGKQWQMYLNKNKEKKKDVEQFQFFSFQTLFCTKVALCKLPFIGSQITNVLSYELGHLTCRRPYDSLTLSLMSVLTITNVFFYPFLSFSGYEYARPQNDRHVLLHRAETHHTKLPHRPEARSKPFNWSSEL